MTTLESPTTDPLAEAEGKDISRRYQRQARRRRSVALWGAGAAVAGLLATTVGIVLTRGGEVTYASGSGLTLTNAAEVLEQAEASYAEWIAATGATTLDDPAPLCYLATQGASGALLPVVACGPSRAQGEISGAYDSTTLDLATSDDGTGITGTAGTTFTAHADLPAGAYLSRPDGLQPVDPSLLDLREEGDHAEIPADALGKGGVIADGEASVVAPWDASYGRTVMLSTEGVVITQAGQATSVTIDGTIYVPGPGQVITVIETTPAVVTPGGGSGSGSGDDDQEQPGGGSTDSGSGGGSTPGSSDGSSITVGGVPVADVDTSTPGSTTTTVIVSDSRAEVGVQVRESADRLAVRDLSEGTATGTDGTSARLGLLPGTGYISNYAMTSDVFNAMYYRLEPTAYRVYTEGDDIRFTLSIGAETWLSAGASVNADSIADIGGTSDHSRDVLLADGEPVGAPEVVMFTDADGNQRVQSLTWSIPSGTQAVVYQPAPRVTFSVIDAVNGAVSEVTFDADILQLGTMRIQAVAGGWTDATLGGAQ